MKKSVRASVAIAALMGLSACGIFKGGGKKTPTLGNDVKVDPSLANVQVLLPDPVANTQWTQSGGNAEKSMGQLALGDTISRAWSARINGGSNRERLAASPVVADGHLYVTDVNATIHSFAADTGAAGWTTEIAQGKENADARFGGGVSYDAGNLYATDGLGDVVALKASDGSVLLCAERSGREGRLDRLRFARIAGRVRGGGAGCRTRYDRCRLLFGGAQRLSLRKRPYLVGRRAVAHQHHDLSVQPCRYRCRSGD
jgi:outer membrane protein assembly factor BamB